ncbi:hypothetical protein F511_35245 [Dorcoceras hygrometricum]|uniref:Uncharacterized protein n=1 Tax=Dorcoceras hygrometricum TaxID=472368 RepID=A0A2Z7CX50_9LAMI|nr:hypothetical protein F511_35245 [Dorcoceras hygrometricum]
MRAQFLNFYADATVIAGTIVSSVGHRKMMLTKDVFTEAFGLPTEGLTKFLNIPKETVVEMRCRFSGSDEPFRAPNKKKGMNMEFRLLNDVVAKALCAKAGSFYMVTSEKFDLMVAISAGLKVKWAQVLFQVLLGMVNNPKRQSQGLTRMSHRFINRSIMLKRRNNRPLRMVNGPWSNKLLRTKTSLKRIQVLVLLGAFLSTMRTTRIVLVSIVIPACLKVLLSLDVFPIYDDATVHSLGPNSSSTANKSTDHSGPHSSERQIVVYTEQHNNIDSEVKENQVSSSAPASLDPPTLQFMDTTSKTLTTLIDFVSSIDLTFACMRDDTNLTKSSYYTTQRHAHKCNSQLQLVDELALVKSQLAEMIDSIKELRDAKKGESGPRSKKSEDPNSRQGDGSSDLTKLDVEIRSEQSQDGQGKTSSEHSSVLVEDRPAKNIRDSDPLSFGLEVIGDSDSFRFGLEVIWDSDSIRFGLEVIGLTALELICASSLICTSHLLLIISGSLLLYQLGRPLTVLA